MNITSINENTEGVDWKMRINSEVFCDNFEEFTNLQSRFDAWLKSGMALLAAGCLLAFSGSVAAQSTNEDEGVKESDFIEEVVVTARKRVERIQDVPISISAYSADDIAAKSLTSLMELGQFTTNFNFFNDGQTGRTSAVINMRGVGQVDPHLPTFDPGVGLYLDGVYLGRMQGNNMDLGDIERVEVLRGPQGTLYGKNTIGGAINLHSAKPTDELEGFAEITVGEYDRIDGRASINVPLVPGELAAKITGATRNRDGHGKRYDFATGNKIDEMGNYNTDSVRALIDWKASENVNVLFSFDGMWADEEGPVRKIVAYAQPELAGLLNMFVDPAAPYGDTFMTGSDFTTFSDEFNSNETDVRGLGMTVDWDLGDWSIKSITSYRDLEVLNGVDPDGSIYRIINEVSTHEQDQFSQELQLSGLSFDDRLNWVMGLYYFEEDGNGTTETDVYTDLYHLSPVFWELWELGVAQIVPPGIPLDIGFTDVMSFDTKSYSAFGQGTYSVTDRFSITAGARYTHDKKKILREEFRHWSGEVVAPMAPMSDNWDAVTGRLGFEYRWTDDLMIYASVARGYKAGGINSRGVDEAEFLPFDEEYIWTYEVGLRSDWADNRVRFNASIYYSDYEDIQYGVIWAGADSVPHFYIANAAEARVKGYEVDFIVTPTPGLHLSAGVGLTDAKYTQADPTTSITMDSDFVKTPEWSWTLAGEYTRSIGDLGELTARLDWVRKSRIYHDALNSPHVVQSGYGILNARLSLEFDDDKWVLSVFGTNLQDKHYILAGTDFLESLGFAEVAYARPKELGASLQYNF